MKLTIAGSIKDEVAEGGGGDASVCDFCEELVLGNGRSSSDDDGSCERTSTFSIPLAWTLKISVFCLDPGRIAKRTRKRAIKSQLIWFEVAE